MISNKPLAHVQQNPEAEAEMVKQIENQLKQHGMKVTTTDGPFGGKTISEISESRLQPFDTILLLLGILSLLVAVVGGIGLSGMLSLSVLERTRYLCRTYVDARVLILTTFDDDEYVFDGILAGAMGYLLKDVSSQELANAVQVVAAGGSMMSPAVARRVLAQVSMPRGGDGLMEPLSAREKDVLKLMSEGLTNAEISTQLHLAGGTIKNYVSSVLQKLNVRDRTQAVIKARELRLLR